MKRRQVTIKDIAARLNISKSTVSRALGGAEDISLKTRERVMRTAREMDYHPNISALNLISGRTRTIGVVIPAFTIPFYARVISAMQNEFLRSGYNIMVCQSNESHEQEKRNLDLLVRSGVDGIALSLARDTPEISHLERLHAKGIPVVMFNRVVRDVAFSTVTVNDFEGARKAASYLLAQGRRSVAFIGGPEGILLARERRLGYERALADSGLNVDRKCIFEGDFSLEDGKKYAEIILASGSAVDAIFCVCDQVAYGVMEVLKGHEIAIPGDIAVMGFTNEAVSSLTSPALTTVGQPMDEIGRRVAEILVGHIDHFSVDFEVVHAEYTPELVLRESG